ncbi:MAG: efflux RND transporter periplasmic adaptor subunit, partial [Thermoguttaceae bacterium]
MELVVAVSGGGDTDELAVHIEPAGRRLANIKTATTKRLPMKRKVRTVGALAYNEGELATIAAYVEGRVERLFADYTGVVVEKGDGLALLYSPELYAAQVEFVQSKSAFERSSQTQSRMGDLQRALYRSARQKLIELGMTEQQVQQLDETGEAQSRMQIGAPIGGTVIEKLAVEGQYVKTGEPIYRIADLSTVWLMLELFPKDAACVRFGQRVEAEVDSIPGEKFSGRVEFVNPVVNPKTRTVGIRVVIPNEEGLLRPGDYATATIDVDLLPMDKAARDVLLVPRGAVLMAGGNSVVYVETEPGRFEIRPVVLGPFADDQVVILKGLEEGDEVATSGNFLIDSQMQLAGKPSVIDPRRAMIEKAVVKKEGPLELDQFEVASIAGRTGADLEQLYQAYFSIQASLAGDAVIEPPVSEAIATAAESLLGAADLPDELRPFVQGIADAAEHLDECDIDEARQDFKAISKAAIQLAARARGVGAKKEFVHFYCPMVVGGEGDWLQASDEL